MPSKGGWKKALDLLRRHGADPDKRRSKISKPSNRKRKRYFSNRRPACKACGEHQWLVVQTHEYYRDPFLTCGRCGENFRMNGTPLEFEYAWRDGIEMPHEVKTKHGSYEQHDLEGHHPSVGPLDPESRLADLVKPDDKRLEGSGAVDPRRKRKRDRFAYRPRPKPSH